MSAGCCWYPGALGCGGETDTAGNRPIFRQFIKVSTELFPEDSHTLGINSFLIVPFFRLGRPNSLRGIPPLLGANLLAYTTN